MSGMDFELYKVKTYRLIKPHFHLHKYPTAAKITMTTVTIRPATEDYSLVPDEYYINFPLP